MACQGYNGKRQMYGQTLQVETLREVSLAYHLLAKRWGKYLS